MKQLPQIANTLMPSELAYPLGTTAKVEGISNNVKMMNLSEYGFRDKEYFMLRL